MVRKFITALILLSAFRLQAQNAVVEEFVAWEVESNQVTEGKSEPIEVSHFEIPLKAVTEDLAPYIPKEVIDALIFEKNGQPHVRWLINPDDTKWHLEVSKYLESKKLDPTHYKYFKAHRTASRSVIVTDPQSGYSFSVKASTNRTAGQWRDKRQEYNDSFDIRFMNDFIFQLEKVQEMENVVTFLEPAAFGLKAINQGFVVRLIDQMADGKKFYLPGFSALHGEEGARIAKLNGSKDPVNFWNEHYMKPLGKALAQLMAVVGIQYDSPHSQNFLIELDEDFRPTGRIALRDFGDIYVQEEFFRMMKRQDIIRRFAATQNTARGSLNVTVGPLHGNKAPDWMTRRHYTMWLKTFFKSYEQEFSKITGVPLEKMTRITNMSYSAYSYGTKDYPMFPEVIRHFQQLAQEALKVDIFSMASPEKKSRAKKTKNICQGLFLIGA